jgi:hypothetical protein
LLSGGTHLHTAVISRSFSFNPSSRFRDCGWLANPALFKALNRNTPEASPVNILPVRLEPCAPGASPITINRPPMSPKAGTGFPQYSQSWYARFFFTATLSRYSTNRGHFRQLIIVLFRVTMSISIFYISLVANHYPSQDQHCITE